MSNKPNEAQAQEPDVVGGRPPFEPSQKQRRDVTIAAGGGMTHEAIAAALGISQPTLRKYFAEELVAGASKRRLEVMNAMFKAAKSGNVAAQKAYIAAGDPAGAAPPEPPPEKPEKPGKKQQAADDAQTAAAGTSWGNILPGHA